MNAAFNTDQVGTSEARWRRALDALPEWIPAPRGITVVAPHPDDETLGAGGLIHLCAKRGHEVTLVLVTDGEKACPEVPDLANVRVTELRAAMTHLAPRGGVRIERLRIADSAVAAHEDALTSVLTHIVARDSVLVSPYEQDGHTDHDATARAAHRAAVQLGVAHLRYPVWAWHRLSPHDLSGLKMRRLLLTDDARAAKAAATACYASQTAPRPGGPIVPPHVLEYFRRPYEVYLL